MDLLTKFNQLKKRRNEINDKIIKMQAIRDMNLARRAELRLAVEAKGYNPDNLDAEIVKLTSKIEYEISEVESKLEEASKIIGELSRLGNQSLSR